MIVFLMSLWGCQTDNLNEVKVQQPQNQEPANLTWLHKDNGSARLDNSSVCGDIMINPMVGLNQKGKVGYVSIGNDQDSLYVNFETDSGWYLLKTYLYVGPASGVPVSHWGMPIVGKFPYQDKLYNSPKHNERDHEGFRDMDDMFLLNYSHYGNMDNVLTKVNDHTMSVPLTNIENSTTVAAFAIIYKWEKFRGHYFIRYQGVWGYGNNKIGKAWGWGWTYDYTIQACQPAGGGVTCYDAWNEGTNSYQAKTNELGWYSTFTPSASSTVKNFYANSGLNDITTGINVGIVSVFYYAYPSSSTYDVIVTYRINDPTYSLTEAHLYIGTTAPSTVPEAYPYAVSGISTNVYQFSFTGVNYSSSTPPTFYIAAEGVTCKN